LKEYGGYKGKDAECHSECDSSIATIEYGGIITLMGALSLKECNDAGDVTCHDDSHGKYE
jgi:hypothetical protein